MSEDKRLKALLAAQSHLGTLLEIKEDKEEVYGELNPACPHGILRAKIIAGEDLYTHDPDGLEARRKLVEAGAILKYGGMNLY